MYIHFTYIYKYKMNLVIEESEQKTSNGGRKKIYIYIFSSIWFVEPLR